MIYVVLIFAKGINLVESELLTLKGGNSFRSLPNICIIRTEIIHSCFHVQNFAL